MFGFGFTGAQDLLRQEAKRFVVREVVPGAIRRARLSASDEHRAIREIRKKVGDMGWLSLNMPARYGGHAIDYVSVGVITEELSKADFGLGCSIPMNIMASVFLNQAAQDVQDEWFPHIMSGDKMHCFAFSEPGAGSDVAAINTRAVRKGEHYVLNGEKCPISHGMHSEVVMVAAKTDMSGGARGVTMFLVPFGLPGIVRTPVSWMGTKYDEPADIVFNEVLLPSKYRLGEEGRGFQVAMQSLDWDRITGALSCLAAAQSALEEAMAWSRHRVAFGLPIVKFEGVSFKLAEHCTLIEAARVLCYRGLWLMDQGLSCTKEAAMAKWLGPREAVDAIHDCMIILGHVGYSQDSLMQKRLRDVMGLEIGGGTGDIQKLIVIRELMGREALPY